MGSGDSVQFASADNKIFADLVWDAGPKKCPFGSAESGNLGVNVDRWVLWWAASTIHRRGF